MNALLINVPNGKKKINFENIIFIKAEGRYSRIVTRNKEYVCCQELQKYEEDLYNHQFIRVHRGYIVNLRHMEHIVNGSIILSNDEEIPVARRRRKWVMEKLNSNSSR